MYPAILLQYNGYSFSTRYETFFFHFYWTPRLFGARPDLHDAPSRTTQQLKQIIILVVMIYNSLKPFAPKTFKQADFRRSFSTTFLPQLFVSVPLIFFCVCSSDRFHCVHHITPRVWMYDEAMLFVQRSILITAQ